MVGLAVFAYPLGLDNNPEWGRGRMVMAALGGLCWLGLVYLWGNRRLSAAWFKIKTGRRGQLLNWLHSYPWIGAAARFFGRIGRNFIQWPLVRAFDQAAKQAAGFWGGLGAALAVLILWWGITSGTMTGLPPYSAYIDHLADAFLAGQLALLEQPPPELLALDNPYDYRNREGLDYLWDASLYNGKYYYYWGPVPGLAAAAAKLLGAGTVDDQMLVFVFLSGLALVMARLLAAVRSRFFPAVPALTLLPWTLLASLAMPLLWLAYRPKFYEAAIAGGQFFLLLGLYAGLRAAASESRSVGWLVLAGAAWGLAVGCRSALLPVVAFFTLMAVVWYGLPGNRFSWRQRISALIALGLPLACLGAGLAWYNVARFGDVFETGHRFQLTGPALPAEYGRVISLEYILPNLYSYFFRPLDLRWGEFPFVFTPYIREHMWPFFIRLPEHYGYSEPVAGILVTTPAVWFSLLPLVKVFVYFKAWLEEKPVGSGLRPSKLLTWWWLMLAGGALLLFGLILVFISSAMRYLADGTAVLVLLAAMGFWWGWTALRDHPVLRRVLSLAALGLILVSLVFSQLGNFQNYDDRFKENNPVLYEALADFLTRR